jgi:ABC-type transport system involved in multi-copper enzyme maturation permease subunit
VRRPVVAALRKDLRITRLFWAPMAFSYAVFLLMAMENIWAYLATGASLAFVMAATAAAIDDRYGTAPLVAALPGTRRSQVAGRYLAWGAVIAAALVLFLGEAALLHALFGARAARLAEICSLKAAAAFLAGVWLAAVVFLPFQFRLGFWPGLWWSAGAGVAVLAAVLNVVGRFAPSAAEAPAAGPFAGALRGLRTLAWTVDRHLSRPEVAAAAAALLALLVWASFRLSVRFHRKRDL